MPDISIDMPTSDLQAGQALTPPDTTVQQSSVLDDLSGHHNLDDMVDMDMGDTSLMDMDVDTGDIDFVHHDEEELGEDPTIMPTIPPSQASEPPVVPDERQAEDAPQGESEQIDEIAPVESETAFGGLEQLTQEEEAAAPPPVTSDVPIQQEPQPPPVVAEEAAIARMTTGEPVDNELDNEDVAAPVMPEDSQPEPPQSAPGDDMSGMVDTRAADEHGLFDDGTFDDLTDMDGDGDDDGLIDFDGGGIGMEDSAFGDALHGMDSRTPGDGGPE